MRRVVPERREKSFTPFLVPDRKTGCLAEKKEEGMAIPSLMEYNDRHPGMRDREMDRSPSDGFVSGSDPFEARRGRTAVSTGASARSQSCSSNRWNRCTQHC